ncbi:mitochondrial import receptor subunit TOM22-like protein [Sarcoptes scabiei]|uniref:Mitochondrial import receptor subunit TOM22 homolog n=1 Tax=Sarcoptes scabiei TaxID=52283 RepID=A0A132AFP7_SARSC|nr:mitochondrial import receptor subunit TOM22-like protein [Sarcoptes scabiei]
MSDQNASVNDDKTSIDASDVKNDEKDSASSKSSSPKTDNISIGDDVVVLGDDDAMMDSETGNDNSQTRSDKEEKVLQELSLMKNEDDRVIPSAPKVTTAGDDPLRSSRLILFDSKSAIENEDDEEDFEDETLSERLWGLTEMFPEPVRDLSWSISTKAVKMTKFLYGFSRSAVWIITTSALILVAPTLIENEKWQVEEMNRQQQRQVILLFSDYRNP